MSGNCRRSRIATRGPELRDATRLFPGTAFGVLGVLFLYGVHLPSSAVAGTEPANHEAPAPIEHGIMLLPTQALYPRYIADPHEVSFSAQIVYVASSDIPQTSVQRYLAQLGGFIPLIEAVAG